MKRSVLIIEPSEIIYKGLATIIEDSTTFHVLHQIDNAINIESSLLSLKPDMVIVNPTLLSTHKHEQTNPIINTIPGTPMIALVYQYVEPESLSIYNAIIDIRDSANKITKILTHSYSTDKDENIQDSTELTDRERDVLILIAKGLMSKEIADNLNISIHTVISHRKNITKKTGIKSIAGLVAYALLNNLIDSSDIE